MIGVGETIRTGGMESRADEHVFAGLGDLAMSLRHTDPEIAGLLNEIAAELELTTQVDLEFHPDFWPSDMIPELDDDWPTEESPSH